MSRLHPFASGLAVLSLLFPLASSPRPAPVSGRIVPVVPLGGGPFTNTGQSLGGETGNGLALGDLDGDGDTDAFVANDFVGLSGEANHVWLNAGDGTFSSGPVLGATDGNAVALGDLDGDGDLEAIVVGLPPSLDAPAGAAGSVQVWLNQGGAQGGTEGTFGLGDAFGLHAGYGVALGDVDNDGDLDALVVGNSNQVWLNDGAAAFIPGPALPFRFSRSAVLAHLDADAYLDAVIADSGAGSNLVLWNDGNWTPGPGSFTAGLVLTTTNLMQGVVAADLDGDNRRDLFLAGSGPDQVFWNDGGRAFSTNGPLALSDNSWAVGLADVDDDDRLDAVVGNIGGDPNRLWHNLGGRVLTVTQEFGDETGSYWARGLGLADLNGDGPPDLFEVTTADDRVWVNQSTPPGGGFVYGGPLTGSEATYGVALGDLNGDGHLDAFAANNGPNRVWLNDFCAHFSPTGQMLGDSWSLDVDLGDLDDDEDLDAFVVTNGPSRVWLNDGSGTFADSGQSLGVFGGNAVELADLDGDSDLDAFVAGAGHYTVWLNGQAGDPPGVFSGRPPIGLGPTIRLDVALGDVDHDGDLDAFTGNHGPNSLLYNLANLGRPGEFAGGEIFGGTDSQSNGVVLGDLNQDGYVDAFIANGGLTRPDEVWLNRADSTGGFADSFQRLGDDDSQDVALGDVDQDGDLDALVANASGVSPGNRLWLNDGSGAFAEGGQALGDAWSRAVALGDLDADGDVDAWVGNDGPSEVWLNNGRTVTCQCVVEWLETNAGPVVPAKASGTVQAIDLRLMFRVRDGVLSQTLAGRHYADRYYDHDPELLALLMANSALRDSALNTIRLWQPNLRALVEGSGNQVTITAEQVQALEAFLDSLSAAASPALQQVLADERARIGPLEDYIGLTMAAARGSVVGYELHLPGVYRP